MINTGEYDDVLAINKEYKQTIFVMELLNVWVAQINKARNPLFFLFLPEDAAWGRERAARGGGRGLGQPFLTLFFHLFRPQHFPAAQWRAKPHGHQIQHIIFPPHDRCRPHRLEAPGPGRVLPQGSRTKPKVSPTAGPHGAQLASLPALTGRLWKPTPPARAHRWGNSGDRSSAEPPPAAPWPRGPALKPPTALRRGGFTWRHSGAAALGPDRTAGCRPRPPAREEDQLHALPRGPGAKATVPARARRSRDGAPLPTRDQPPRPGPAPRLSL